MSQNLKTLQELLDLNEREYLRYIVDDCLKTNPDDREALFYRGVLLQDAKDADAWVDFERWLHITVIMHDITMVKAIIALMTKLEEIGRPLHVPKEIMDGSYEEGGKESIW
jgi:hypothetical protein